MKWTHISAFIGTVLLVIWLILFIAETDGCKDEAFTSTEEPNEPAWIVFDNPPEPDAVGSIWLTSFEKPPPVIYYQGVDGAIEYIPRPNKYFCAKCNKEIPELARMELYRGYVPELPIHTCEPEPEPND